MRVLHVIRSLDPRCGGPPTVLRNLVREQVHLGYEVTILTTTAQDATAQREPRAAHERALRLHPSYSDVDIFFARAYTRGPKPWNSFAYAPQLKRWLHRRIHAAASRPDLIHIHGVFEYGSMVAAQLARRHGIPYLVETFGGLDAVLFQQRSRWLKRAYMHLLFHHGLSDADYVHPASEHEVPHVRRWAPSARLRVIPHGTDIPEFDRAQSAQRFRTKFPPLEGKRVILFLSRVAAKKRPEWLVEALARLQTEFPDLVLLLAGARIDHTAVVEAAAKRFHVEDKVIDVGFLQGEDIHGAFAVADVFALPSLDENFGLAVTEAMAHGVPALVTPGVASHMYIDASGGGITVEDDFEAVVAGLRTLLCSDTRDLGGRGKEYVQSHLSWRAIAGQIDTLYREAIAARS